MTIKTVKYMIVKRQIKGVKGYEILFAISEDNKLCGWSTHLAFVKSMKEVRKIINEDKKTRKI